MKKILSCLLGLSLFISACDPMADINEEIDAKDISFVKKVELTLEDGDYEAIGGDVADNGYFDESNSASDLIPTILAEKYPGLTSGSAVNVTYQFKGGYPDLNRYTDASYYKLEETDYNTVSPIVAQAQHFSPKNPADEYIPGILAEAITDAQDGDIYIVAHMYSDIEPDYTAPEEITVFEFEFATDLGAFTTVDEEGEKSWYQSSYSGLGYAKMSGYSGGAQPNVDWLISPLIDLTEITESKLAINQAVNYLGDDWSQVQILVSSNYDGSNPASATWTEMIPANKPAGNNWDFVESGSMDISAFDGETIHVAFKYTSSNTNAPTWEVNKVTVSGMDASGTKSGIIAEPVKIEEFYTYNSGWSKTKDAYYVTIPDYDAMGAPGKYNNFSSSAKPDNYLPQMMMQKFAYAQEGDVMVVTYKYYSGGTQTRADEYHFSNGAWNSFNPMIEKTDQFILTKSSGWVFDPTVTYTMASNDYLMMVNWVKSNKGASYIDSYGTAEFYFGAGSYYSNFDLREGKWDSSTFDTWQDAVKEGIATAFLPGKFPNAVAQVSGIDVMYQITFATYDGSGAVHTFEFQCTKSGPNPEFTFVRVL